MTAPMASAPHTIFSWFPPRSRSQSAVGDSCMAFSQAGSVMNCCFAIPTRLGDPTAFGRRPLTRFPLGMAPAGLVRVSRHSDPPFYWRGPTLRLWNAAPSFAHSVFRYMGSSDTALLRSADFNQLPWRRTECKILRRNDRGFQPLQRGASHPCSQTNVRTDRKSS